MTVRYLERHAASSNQTCSLSLSAGTTFGRAFPPSRYCGAVLVHCVPSPLRSPEVDWRRRLLRLR